MKRIFLLALVMVLSGGSMASAAEAFDLEAFRQRSAERISKYVDRIDNATEDAPTAGETPLPNVESNQFEEASNECRFRFDLERPQVGWSGNSLVLVPRVDARITSDTEPGNSWQADLNYTGSVEFLEGTMALPTDSTFGGEHSWSGPGGNSRFRFSGQALPQVTLANLDRASFGKDDELEGRVRMTGAISGCDSAEFDEQFTFSVRRFGDIRSASWRRVR